MKSWHLHMKLYFKAADNEHNLNIKFQNSLGKLKQKSMVRFIVKKWTI